MKSWRAAHPVMSAWHSHLQHAKERFKTVEWTYGDFQNFCTLTGYHYLREEGYEIHRMNSDGPYALWNCMCVLKEFNYKLSIAEKWRKIRNQTKPISNLDTTVELNNQKQNG